MSRPVRVRAPSLKQMLSLQWWRYLKSWRSYQDQHSGRGHGRHAAFDERQRQCCSQGRHERRLADPDWRKSAPRTHPRRKWLDIQFIDQRTYGNFGRVGLKSPPLTEGWRSILQPERNPGKVLRLRGKGLPSVKQIWTTADLLIRVGVYIPEKLTGEEKEMDGKTC